LLGSGNRFSIAARQLAALVFLGLLIEISALRRGFRNHLFVRVLIVDVGG